MYRITGWDDLYSTGYFDYLDAGATLIIEWSENIEAILPQDCVRVTITKCDDPDERQIEIIGAEILENISEGGRLISECFVNAALTHSRTLMPMVDNALTQADMSFADIDALSVNVGPGSFTGIRIGVAAVKGLALSGDKPCAGVSTLLSAAYNFADDDCLVCVAMDARCNQVYTALFECSGGKVARICEDKAVPIAELEADLACYDKKI